MVKSKNEVICNNKIRFERKIEAGKQKNDPGSLGVKDTSEGCHLPTSKSFNISVMKHSFEETYSNEFLMNSPTLKK